MSDEKNKGYGLVDEMKSILRLRKSAYQQTFDGHGAPRQVLIDLARFCRATESVFHPNESMKNVLIGRNEVWLRIQQHLNLSSEELFQLQEGRRNGR